MRKAIPLVVLTLASVAAGCGDDEDESISRAEYIARSGASCERSGQQAGEQFERIVGEEGRPAPGEEERFVTKAQRFLKEGAIPSIRQNIEERRNLPTPEGDEEQIEAILAAGEKALAGFERVADDRAQVRGLFEGKIPDPATEFDALSRRYGIDKCGGDQ
jgi:hypothetical protein